MEYQFFLIRRYLTKVRFLHISVCHCPTLNVSLTNDPQSAVGVGLLQGTYEESSTVNGKSKNFKMVTRQDLKNNIYYLNGLR